MPAGRPTDYREEYAEQVLNYCLLGCTDKELAELFDVSEATINNWKQAHPEFLESILDGRARADSRVARALYKRAEEGDTRAAEIWLRNRQSSKWRDKQLHEHEVKKTTINVVTGIKEGVGSESSGDGSD